MNPIVSIVMPYWNRPALLKETLEQYLNLYRKELHLFEISIVDDGSQYENNIYKVIEPFQSSFQFVASNFKTHHEPRNPAKALNRAIEQSCGEIICITNPECFHKDPVLLEVIDFFSKNREGFIQGLVRNVGHPRREDWWTSHPLFSRKPYHNWTAIRRKDFKKIGGFNERYMDGIGYEDEEWILNLTDLYPDYAWTNGIVFHRYHGELYLTTDNQNKSEKNRKIFESFKEKRNGKLPAL